MATVTITDANFQQDVLKSSQPVLVDFWAEWCGPCKALAPVLEDVAKETAGKVTIAKVNIDEYPDIANKYRIRSIPTMILFKNGEPAGSKVGSISRTALLEWLQTAA